MRKNMVLVVKERASLQNSRLKLFNKHFNKLFKRLWLAREQPVNDHQPPTAKLRDGYEL